MDCTGRFVGASVDYISRKFRIMLEINESEVFKAGFDKLKDIAELSIKIEEFKQKRSLDANALMWHCLQQMAKHLKLDKWSVYLMMLKDYGQFTHIYVEEECLDSLKKQWRETEVVGDVVIDGKKMIQVLCYFGSSTYNTAEFSHLLEGIIGEMEQMGLEPPTSKQMLRALELWEKKHENSSPK